jgi:hypothetical protein
MVLTFIVVNQDRGTWGRKTMTHGGPIHSFGGSNQSLYYLVIQHGWSQLGWIKRPFCGTRNAWTSAPCTSYANQWGNRFKLNIPEFQGDLQPEEFLDWMLVVEEVFEFNGVLDE